MIDKSKIYEVKSFFDDSGKTVRQFDPLDKMTKSKFSGSAAIQTAKGVFPVEFEFTEDFSNVEDCFDRFEQALKKFIEKKMDENRIITNETQGGNLIIP